MSGDILRIFSKYTNKSGILIYDRLGVTILQRTLGSNVACM